MQYNEEHGIVPATVVKAVRALISQEEHALAEPREAYTVGGKMPKDELARLIKELEKDMKQAAKDLEFEKAALLRDQIFDLRQQLDAKDTRPEWEKLRSADLTAGFSQSPCAFTKHRPCCGSIPANPQPGANQYAL